MFTLRFIQSFDQGKNAQKVVSACAYDIFDRGQGSYIISVYMNNLGEGIDFHVTSEEMLGNTYSTCFVTNEAGKTIEHIKASKS